MGEIVGDPYQATRVVRQVWPTCPTHNHKMISASRDWSWMYCKGVGWHPADFWENQRWERDK